VHASLEECEASQDAAAREGHGKAHNPPSGGCQRHGHRAQEEGRKDVDEAQRASSDGPCLAGSELRKVQGDEGHLNTTCTIPRF